MKKTIVLILLTGTMFFVGCSENGENISEKVDVETIKEKTTEIVNNRLGENEQINVIKEYYSFIEKKMDEDKIINFLKDNIQNLDEFRVDEMLLQLENHLYAKGYDTKGVLEKMAPHVQYGSDELKSYFRIWNNEVENETTDGAKLNISVDKILQRAMEIEKHIDKFPEGKTRTRLEDLYETYMSMAIKGLHGNQYIYAQDGDSTLKKEVLEAYKEIIRENPDSRTAKILQNYIEELEKDEMNLDGENTLYFYDNVERIIQNIKKDGQ